jgi:hypothetical protein
MLIIKGNGYTPIKRSPRNTEILKSTLNEIKHLIAARLGLDELRMLFDVLEETRSILAQTEKVALFLYELNGALAVGAVPIFEAFFYPEGLTWRTIPALIGALIDITLIVNRLENSLYCLMVSRVGGADKVIVFNIHCFPEALKGGHDFIHISLRGNPSSQRSPLNFLTMLIRTGDKIDLATGKTVPAG